MGCVCLLPCGLLICRPLLAGECGQVSLILRSVETLFQLKVCRWGGRHIMQMLELVGGTWVGAVYCGEGGGGEK